MDVLPAQQSVEVASGGVVGAEERAGAHDNLFK